jgi:hypothetical protein
VKLALFILTYGFAVLAAYGDNTSICGNWYASFRAHAPSLDDPALESARNKMWDLFVKDLEEGTAHLNSQQKAKLSEALNNIQLTDNGGARGHGGFMAAVTPTSCRHVAIDIIKMCSGLYGKTSMVVMLRHEIEHAIELLERGENLPKTFFVDFFHPRTRTTRFERRAFTRQYKLAQSIQKEVDRKTILEILFEESRLPKEYHDDFIAVLDNITPTENGSWKNPLNPYHPKAAILGDAAMDSGAGAFIADQTRVSYMRLSSYLRNRLRADHYRAQNYDQGTYKYFLNTAYAFITVIGGGITIGESYHAYKKRAEEKLRALEATSAVEPLKPSRPYLPPQTTAPELSSSDAEEKATAKPKSIFKTPVKESLKERSTPSPKVTKSSSNHLSCGEILSAFPTLAGYVNGDVQELEIEKAHLRHYLAAHNLTERDIAHCFKKRRILNR